MLNVSLEGSLHIIIVTNCSAVLDYVYMVKYLLHGMGSLKRNLTLFPATSLSRKINFSLKILLKLLLLWAKIRHAYNVDF